MNNETGIANVDIHNFAAYLIKQLVRDVWAWNNLKNIEPDNHLLDIVNEQYFLEDEYIKDKDPMYLAKRALGRKLNIRGKHIYLVYNQNEELTALLGKGRIKPIPACEFTNMEEDSNTSYLINMNYLIDISFINIDYSKIFNFFYVFFDIIFDSKSDDRRIGLFAIFAYVEYLYKHILNKETIDYIDFFTHDECAPISLCSKLIGFKNPFIITSIVLDHITNGKFKELYYYPTTISYLKEAASKETFNLYTCLQFCDSLFKNQIDGNYEYHEPIMDLKDLDLDLPREDKIDAFKKAFGFLDDIGLFDSLPELEEFDLKSQIIDLVVEIINDLYEEYGFTEQTEREGYECPEDTLENM